MTPAGVGAPYVLYDYLPSGNGYKVRLVCKYLAIPYTLVQMDLTHGATRTAEFLAKKSERQNSVVGSAGARVLVGEPRHHRIPCRGQRLDTGHGVPARSNVAVDEFRAIQPGTEHRHCSILAHLAAADGRRTRRTQGHQALQVLEEGLHGRSYLAGDQFTLADIALYAYTHVAPQGGFALEQYPAINAWLQRVAAQPHHTLITQP